MGRTNRSWVTWTPLTSAFSPDGRRTRDNPRSRRQGCHVSRTNGRRHVRGARRYRWQAPLCDRRGAHGLSRRVNSRGRVQGDVGDGTESRKKVARALCFGDPGVSSLRIQHACCSLSHSSGGAALGRSAPTAQGKTASIDPAPTHAEIASRTSTHREAVTRELNRLTKMGILEQRSRVLWIKDLARLEALVRDAGGE